MYRYLILQWPQTDDNGLTIAAHIGANLNQNSPHSWRSAWEAPGIIVLVSGECKYRMQTYGLADDSGVILGKLFKGNFTSVTENLGRAEAHACVRTKGQHLVKKYWGRYVAILNNCQNSTRHIIRDPSGALPCFHTMFRGINIYFSDIQDAADLNILDFTVNWDYIKSNIIIPHYQKRVTALNEVSEVLPAQCIEVTGFEKKSYFLWNPTAISRNHAVENHEQATQFLRDTVTRTVQAHAECYNSIMHYIGGLDSSIVLSSIMSSKNPTSVNALTTYTQSTLGDEREYTNQVTNMYGVPLHEIRLDHRRVDLNRMFHINKRTNPFVFDCIDISGDGLNLKKKVNAQAAFTGVGGDNVFFQIPSNLSALDYVKENGILNKNVVKVILEASRYGRKSIFSTLYDVTREKLAPRSCHNHVQDILFELRDLLLINTDIMEAQNYESSLHPLLIPDANDSKAKHLHILSSAFFSIPYYDPWDTDYQLERVRPLLSQPIVEACLRIPTWLMTYGGVDRGLARKAFKDMLPENITKRYSKGTPWEFYQDIYKSNISMLKEILLDGSLVSEGILLRDKLEAVLDKKDQFILINTSEILNYAAQEAWIASWKNIPSKKQISRKKIAI